MESRRCVGCSYCGFHAGFSGAREGELEADWAVRSSLPWGQNLGQHFDRIYIPL